MKKLRLVRGWIKYLAITELAMTICFIAGQNAFAVNPPDGEFTLDAEFDTGSAINVVHSNSDQLQLDDTTVPFNFIWLAVSSKGTVVKIDTETGEVLGEYRTAPHGMGLNPSRTTVDLNGNVWVGNRSESGSVPAGAASPGIPASARSMGSVVHFGLEENGGCVDRNGNGVIDTSTGQGDVRDWSNAGNADIYGGVATAEDECIIRYVRVNSTGTRHVSVNSDNDVWVSGTGGQNFDLVDGDTGTIVRQESSVGYGGYGGLIDGNGVIWSAARLLRWDTALPLSGPNGGNWTGYSHSSYGLCIDNDGNVWNTEYGPLIRKFAPDGTLLGTYNHGSNGAQGCVVDNNGDVWVAGSLSGNTVDHLLNDGTFVGSVTVGSGPTGVAVDAVGKIWATNYSSRTASRIDPNAGPIGGGGVRIGAVDFTTGDLGGNLYNYSDMTGSTLTGAPNNGTWTAVHDAMMDDITWKSVSWTAAEPGDSSITVTVASSVDSVTFGPEIAVTNGSSLSMATGRYLRLTVRFTRSSTDEDMDTVNDSPVLYDISVDAVPPNEPPVAQCKDVTLNIGSNGQAVLTSGQMNNGSSDPDPGDVITFDLSKTNFNCSDIGTTHAVTLTVTDDSGEVDSCVANVTVVDNTAPAVQTQGVTVQLDVNGNASISAADINNGSSDNCGIASISVSPTSFTCANVGANTVTLTVTDNNGNVGTATATVTVEDNTAPVVLTQDIVAHLDDTCNASITADDINAGSSDACGIASLSVDQDSFTCSDIGDNTVTLTVTDNNGNSSSATATVTIPNRPPNVENAYPSTDCFSMPPDHRMEEISIEGVTDPDGQPVNLEITSITSDEPIVSGGCADAYIGENGTAELRVERYGRNGRVYVVNFTASDGQAESDGSVKIVVPYGPLPRYTCEGVVDNGQNYDAADEASCPIIRP